MIITISHHKGGVGKTTVALHVAALLARRGPTALFDGDPNRSALAWRTRGAGLPFEVFDHRLMAKKVRAFDHVVIDTEARPDEGDLKELAEGSDLLVVPTFPDALSLTPLGGMVEQLAAVPDANYRVLLNQVPAGRVGQEALDLLDADGIPHFRTLVRGYAAYRHASDRGTLVSELRDKSARTAWSDFLRLDKELTAAAGVPA